MCAHSTSSISTLHSIAATSWPSHASQHERWIPPCPCCATMCNRNSIPASCAWNNGFYMQAHVWRAVWDQKSTPAFHGTCCPSYLFQGLQAAEKLGRVFAQGIGPSSEPHGRRLRFLHWYLGFPLHIDIYIIHVSKNVSGHGYAHAKPRMYSATPSCWSLRELWQIEASP